MLTSTILVAEVRETPNVAKSNAVAKGGEHELGFTAPFITNMLVLCFFNACTVLVAARIGPKEWLTRIILNFFDLDVSVYVHVVCFLLGVYDCVSKL